MQLGLTTYCYRDIPHGLEEVLQYVLQSGVNTLEMGSVLEEGLGIPQAPRRPAKGVELSDKEKAERAKIVEGLKEESAYYDLFRLCFPA